MNIHQDILIIGTGNVATHLAIALQRSSHNLLGIVGRNYDKAKALAHTFEMGKYHEYSSKLNIVCAKKDIEETLALIKDLDDLLI